MSRSENQLRGLRPSRTTAATTSPKLRTVAPSNRIGSNFASTSCSRACRSAASPAVRERCGPAVRSAAVNAEIAMSSGKAWTTFGSRQSTTTDVSSKRMSRHSPWSITSSRSARNWFLSTRNAGARQLRDPVAGDEGALAGPQGPELGDRFAIARHDKVFASRHGLDHLRVLVAQLTLCIGVWARNTAHRTQRRYLLANWRRLTTVLPPRAILTLWLPMRRVGHSCVKIAGWVEVRRWRAGS